MGTLDSVSYALLSGWDWDQGTGWGRVRYTQGRCGLASCLLCEGFAGFGQSGGLGRRVCCCGRRLRRGSGRLRGGTGGGSLVGLAVVVWF